jgi:hypothetical protein
LKITIHKYKEYFFGGLENDPVAYDRIIDEIEKPTVTERPGVLSGRHPVARLSLDSDTELVLKAYYRGGLIRFINRRHYLALGHSRGQREFEMLSLARDAGLNCPQPIVFVSQGSVLCKAWLGTRNIVNSRTLRESSQSEPQRARLLLPAVKVQLEKLVAANILHVDLHPGNILVGADNGVYLIDFDKATLCDKGAEYLRRRYTQRWKRAIAKYNLPEWLKDCIW